MAALLDLSATASHTDIICTWDLSDSPFSAVTSMVLTYTDLSSNEWINVPVSGNSPAEYTEIISDLSANTDFKVYLSVFGKNKAATPVKILMLSNVVIVTTGTPVTRPTIALLAGKTYLQVLFKEEGAADTDLTPYDFASENCDIDGFVVSCNDLDANAGDNAGHENAAPSARLFSKADVQTYSFSVGGVEHTYKYVLITDLQENTLHEVAVTYYNANGIGSISNTLQRRTAGGGDTFASFAVNDLFDGNVGATPSITVTWRDPVKAVHPDTVADVASRPKSILRQYFDGEDWVNDVTYNLYQVSDAELLTGFTYNSGHYSGDGSGNFTYSADATGLVAGRQYQYVITMRDIADTVDITSTTNYLGNDEFDPVVALQRPTFAIPASALTLNVQSGEFSFDAAFSAIVTNTGGFDEIDFSNNNFRLEYSIDNGENWEYKEITNVEGQLTCDNITRGSSQSEVQFKVTAIPSHTTRYIEIQGSAAVTTFYQYADPTSGVLTGNYNTTLPSNVDGFTYTNVTVADADTADGSITLTWDSSDNQVDGKTNELSLVFYRVVATKQSNPTVSRNFFLSADFTNVASYITLAANDLSGNYTDNGSTHSYTFNDGGAFFARAQEYMFTIQRGYVNLNSIASSPAGESGANDSELLYGNVATEDYALRMFKNPPPPTVNNYAFNTSTSAFTFNLGFGSAYAYGFSTGETYFEYSLNGQTAVSTLIAGGKTIDMSEIGARGDSFTLTVREYVETEYLSTGATDKFYSSDVTFEFKKQGPLDQPESFISYKNTGLENQDGTQMKIEWALVTDDAADALEVPVYYQLMIYDETAEEQHRSVAYFLLPSASDATMFKAADLAGLDYATYTVDNGKGVLIYTGLTLGHYYTYTIVARYYAPDFNAYVYGDAKPTGYALLAFGPLPVPSALIDVESNGITFNFDMAYNTTNHSGVLNDNMDFEYTKLDETGDPIGDPVALVAGENQVAVSDKFAGIAKGDIILVGFRTQFSTYSASNGTTDKFTSDIVSNFASVNPVTFTYSPQIKSFLLTYNSGNANIFVTHEINGEQPTEVHAVTTSLDVNDASTTATYYDGSATVSKQGTKADDYMYALTVPGVKVGGLKFLSIALHNSNGLDVAQASVTTGGLVAGNYILDPANPTIFEFVSQ
jgi:hypothetical protein